VRLLAIRPDTGPGTARLRAGFRRTPSSPACAMTVMVPLELEEPQLQVGGRPEEQPVQAFAPNGADQAFDEGMRERHVRHRLDLVDVEDPQVRLPLVAFVQPIVVRTEVGRWGVITRRSVEHATQPHAIHGAAVHAKTHDATRALVHDHEHPG
jgi:hypothetical protein